MRQVEQEGPVAVGADERDGTFGVTAGEGGLIDRRLHHAFAVDQRQGFNPHHLPERFAGRPLVGVVAVRQAEVLVETVAAWSERLGPAEMPFADAGRGVAPRF